MLLDERFKWLSKYSRLTGAAPSVFPSPQRDWAERDTSGQSELASQRERVVLPANRARVASSRCESALPGQVSAERVAEKAKRALPRQHSSPRNRVRYDDCVPNTPREERGVKRAWTPDRHPEAFSPTVDNGRRDLPSSQRYYTEGRAYPTVDHANAARSSSASHGHRQGSVTPERRQAYARGPPPSRADYGEIEYSPLRGLDVSLPIDRSADYNDVEPTRGSSSRSEFDGSLVGPWRDSSPASSAGRPGSRPSPVVRGAPVPSTTIWDCGPSDDRAAVGRSSGQLDGPVDAFAGSDFRRPHPVAPPAWVDAAEVEPPRAKAQPPSRGSCLLRPREVSPRPVCLLELPGKTLC